MRSLPGHSASLALVIVLAACGTTPAPKPSPSPSAPSSAPAPAIAPAVAPAIAEGDAGAPLSSSGPDAEAPAVATKPPPVERSGKTWPFHGWDRAEAFTFNRFRMRPGAPFRIYDDEGWSKHVGDRKPLDATLAKQAVDLVLAGKSELEMTKCPFPRHAVVFYDHDIPVASVNVCFECGDILLWPRWGKPEADWDKLTDAQKKKALAELEAESTRKQKLFDQVFPKWKTFFRDSVGFPIDEKWH